MTSDNTSWALIMPSGCWNTGPCTAYTNAPSDLRKPRSASPTLRLESGTAVKPRRALTSKARGECNVPDQILQVVMREESRLAAF